jgi:RimJ/RimL family protein N-acetyltransferase
MLLIETERLILRRFTLGDLQDIHTFSSDPVISRHLNGFPGPSIDDVQSYIEIQNTYEPGDLDKCFDLGVHLRSENKIIGLITLIQHKHFQGEIGFALNVEYQRKGYAAEAVRAAMAYGFTTLEMHRIFARTGRDNISSWLLLERVGMRREGLFLHDHCVDGKWHDTFVYALLEEEWSGKNKNLV